MNEELELLKVVSSRLEKAGIEYMMTGSMAMALYSVPRMTRDIDIIIQVSSAHVSGVVSLFKEDFYIDEATVRQAVQDKAMFNIIHSESIIKVDFIVRKDEDYRVEEFSRKKSIVVDGMQIWVTSPEDLILSKIVWSKGSNSEMQLRDARYMLQVSREIDFEYLRKWAKVLGIEQLLSKAINND